MGATNLSANKVPDMPRSQKPPIRVNVLASYPALDRPLLLQSKYITTQNSVWVHCSRTPCYYSNDARYHMIVFFKKNASFVQLAREPLHTVLDVECGRGHPRVKYE